MVGPLKKAPGGFTHLLVVVDKFTKWIEAKPITNIHSKEAVKFFLIIICQFGVSNCISPTTEQTSLGISSWTSMMDMASGSIGPQLDTCVLMVRSSGAMAWSSKDSSPTSSTDSKNMSGDGLQRS